MSVLLNTIACLASVACPAALASAPPGAPDDARPPTASADAARADVATRLTLSFSNASAAKVISAMQRQLPFGLEISAPEIAQQRVTVEATDEPFWQVIAKLDSQWKLRVKPHPFNSRRLSMAEGGAPTFGSRAQHLGAIAVDPLSVTVRSAESYQATGQSIVGRSATLTVNLFAEPQLCPLDLTAIAIEAIDDRGRPLKIEPARGERAGGNRPSAALPVQAQVAINVPTDAKAIARLRGEVRYKRVTKWGAVDIADLEKREYQSVELADGRATVRVEKIGEATVVNVAAAETRNPHDERFLRLRDMLVCEDAAGRRLERTVSADIKDGNAHFEWPATFKRSGQTGEPKRVYFETIDAVKDVAVPFVMTDIPLGD